MGERKNLVYSIPGPDGIDIKPIRQWLWGKERTFDALQKGELEFIKGKDGKYTVHTKQYLKDDNGSVRQGKLFSIIDDIYTQHGTNEIIDLFGNAQIFPFPKPTGFIKKSIDIGTTGQDEEIVLDFFAGSSSTAHAIMIANSVVGNRKFIMIQLDEACDDKSEAFKAGFKSIAEIGKERIRRAGKKIKEESATTAPNLDVGFRVLKVDTSNMQDVYYNPDAYSQDLLFKMTDNIKPDRTEEDLLFQVLLDWGVDLSLPVTKETIAELPVYFVNDNALAACFVKDGTVTEEFCKGLAKRQPLRVVFRDAGLKDDSVRINGEQIFKLMSSHTDVKTI